MEQIKEREVIREKNIEEKNKEKRVKNKEQKTESTGKRKEIRGRGT